MEHLPADAAARRLKKAGYPRTTTAVAVRRKRLGLKVATARADAGLYTANALARLFGIDIHQVLGWSRARACRPSAAALRARRRKAATSGRSASRRCASGWRGTRN